MRLLPITCNGFLVLLLLSAACATVVDAGKTAPEGPSMIAPTRAGDKYENWIATPIIVEGGSMSLVMWKWIQGGERERPVGEIPVVPLDKDSFSEIPAEGLMVRWLGHSTVLVEMSGRRVLIDPVLDTYASPIRGFTRRFSKAPVRLEDLPAIDAVVISHDHYDHLEKGTVVALSERVAAFFVPSGVGQYLRTWGVPPGRIRELSWWEEVRIGPLTFICVPARHFSGRGLFDRNETLWAGWIIRSDGKSLYHSGDTGYANHFAAIGDRYGPFDLTLIKIGAYNDAWPYIHLDPEQAVKAHTDLRGKVLLPVHWATFTLALHPWDDPIVRVLKAAKQNEVRIVTPKIGELVDIDKPIANRNWWEEVK
jgi:L-ascorbate metabolism protein UlaG (beta-lactamase superfamily)